MMADTYTTIQGDTWDLIAKKVCGDEKKLDILMQNNPSFLEYLVFPAGIRLRCPKELSQPERDMPSWRR